MVNDSLGHEIGSRLLVEAANLLRATFRGGEVVARVDGDEFAVVTHKRKDELVAALKRLDTATAAANSSDARCYRISYSMGEASIQAEGNESFGSLVDRAHALMYGRKRKRKVDRDAAAASIGHDTPIIDPEATGELAAYVSGGVSPKLERHRK
jgi:diguanylate cyclase (GGDEF)-like protein